MKQALDRMRTATVPPARAGGMAVTLLGNLNGLKLTRTAIQV